MHQPALAYFQLTADQNFSVLPVLYMALQSAQRTLTTDTSVPDLLHYPTAQPKPLLCYLQVRHRRKESKGLMDENGPSVTMTG